MRVIQTTAFFERRKSIFRKQGETGPAVTFAWFKNTGDGKLDYEKLPELLDAVFPGSLNPVSRDIFRLVVQGNSFEEGFSASEIDLLWSYPIIVEQSPPTEIPFAQLLKQSPSIAVGTYIGISAIGDAHPLLMLVSVPAGIIVIGVASGVAKALEAGLQKNIAAIFNGTPSPTPRRRKGSPPTAEEA